MSARDAIVEAAHTLHEARAAVNSFAAEVHKAEARQLMAEVVEHTITALSSLREQLLAPSSVEAAEPAAKPPTRAGDTPATTAGEPCNRT